MHDYKLTNIFYLPKGNVFKCGAEGNESYLIRENRSFRVCVPYEWEENHEIFRRFVGMAIRTTYLNYTESGKSFKVLCLEANDFIERRIFLKVAADFIDKDVRNELLGDPDSWADAWANLFGDSISKRSVSDLLGEMIAFKFVREINSSAKWEGRSGTSQDILCNDCSYEVKTTTIKKETLVSINSAFQIQFEKAEKLLVVRLEQVPGGCYSIDNLKFELVANGVSDLDIEEILEGEGLYKGHPNRRTPYDLLEVLSFDVNAENFPAFRLQDLNEKAPKGNIIDFKLVLDLSGVPREIIYQR